MKNGKNLIPLSSKTPEERKRIASAGGKASAKARKEQASLKTIAEAFLKLPKSKGKKTEIESLKSLEDIEKANFDLKTLIVLQQLKKASEGDLKSAEWIQNLIGENVFEGTIIQTTSPEQMDYIQALKDTLLKKTAKDNSNIIDYKEKKGTEEN